MGKVVSNALLQTRESWPVEELPQNLLRISIVGWIDFQHVLCVTVWVIIIKFVIRSQFPHDAEASVPRVWIVDCNDALILYA